MTKERYNKNHNNLFNVFTMCIQNIESIYVTKVLTITIIITYNCNDMAGNNPYELKKYSSLCHLDLKSNFFISWRDEGVNCSSQIVQQKNSTILGRRTSPRIKMSL